MWEVQGHLLSVSVQLQRQKAAVLIRVRQLQRKLTRSQQQVELLREELNEERENGQVSLTSQGAEGRAVSNGGMHSRSQERGGKE